MTAALRRLRATLFLHWLAFTSALPSLLATLAALVGWAALTFGLATALSLLHPALYRAVWGLSAGIALLVLSLGWRVLTVMAMTGLYSLYRESRK